jgi:hypothetical protein
MSASMLEMLCQITELRDGDSREADVTIRVTRPERYEVRWRRWYPLGGWSDYRVAVGVSLLEALAEAFSVELDNDEQPAGVLPCECSPAGAARGPRRTA